MSDINPRGIASNSAASSNPKDKAPLDRALEALSRDSAERRRYLQSRWQGAMKDLNIGATPHVEANFESWWWQRHQTPLGRALSRLDKC